MTSVDLASSTVVVPEVGDDIDPWGAEDEAEHSASTPSQDLEREWEARRVQFHNGGFNKGYLEAVAPGFNWGVARGAASAFSALPSSIKELLLKDQEARKRLEALNSAISSISSDEATGMYYKDTVLEEGRLQRHLQDDVRNTSAVQSSREGERMADQSGLESTANASCGGGSCGNSNSCSLQAVDGVAPNGRQETSNASIPQSTRTGAPGESSGSDPVSEEAYKLILRVGTSSDEAKQLEDSTTSHLVSLALGNPDPSASTSRGSESLSRLEQYQRDVKTELELSSVMLSSFPQSSETALGVEV